MNQFKLTRHSRLRWHEAAVIGTTFQFQSRRLLSFQSHAEFCELADAKELLKNLVFDFFSCAMYVKLWKNVRRVASLKRFIHQAATGTIRYNYKTTNFVAGNRRVVCLQLQGLMKGWQEIKRPVSKFINLKMKQAILMN